MKGFFNSYLLIDLADRSWKRVALTDAVLEKYWGGKGLGVHLLRKHTKGRPDPFSGDNPLIFAIGPANDSRIAGSSRWMVMTRSPQTGFLAHSYSGGRLSKPMSRTGYDAFVVMGASDKPVWLEIEPESVTFHDAEDLWGKDTQETEAALRERTGGKAGALVVGPAGENLVRFANVTNDTWRQAGRSGAGAVMGAKRIKGITFHGDRARPHASPDDINSYWKEMIAACRANPAVERYRRLGTPMMVEVLNNAGAFPARYWHQGQMEGWRDISADFLLDNFKVTRTACEQCFVACAKLTEAVSGPHKGLILEGPEYETIYAFGGLCLIKSLEDILLLNDLCDKLGLDTITAGNLVAFAMEASELGVFPSRIAYGDTAAAMELIKGIAKREDPGAGLADGIIAAARGLGLDDLAVHVKGMEPAGYDPRVLKGMGLAYGVSDRGACHLRATFYKPELAGMIDKDAVEGKAALFIDFEDRATLFDSLVLCRFYRDLYTWEQLARIVRMTTGLDLDREGLAAVARNVADEARRFNIDMGLTANDDTLPGRFHTEPIPPSNSVLSEEDYFTMRADYYHLRGWDEEGRPPAG